MQDVTSLRGQLIVASPAIDDPNFHRAVVLIGHHDRDGALGVVINRPSGSQVAEAAPPVAEMIGGDSELHFGGPVMPEAVVVVAEFESADDAAIIAFGTVGVLPADSKPQMVAERTHRLRAYAGHAGWSSGQLDAEVEREDWIIAPAEADLVFSLETEDLWSDVLKSLGGSYELLSRMPEDPSVN